MHYRQKDAFEEMCLMLRNGGIAISPKDFQQDAQANSLTKWNVHINQMERKYQHV